MRKNGINRELSPVDGGVCAPAGFRANGVVCLGGEKLSIVLTDGRYPAAFAYTAQGVCGAPVQYTKNRLKSGYARAIVVNGGSANIGDGAKPAIEKLCLAVSNAAKIPENEIAVASTGVIGKIMRAETVLPSVSELINGAAASGEKSLTAAQNLTTHDGVGKQLSFSFQLGDFTCKIGAIFKGNKRVCPNMATFLCFFTTDVNISSEMLQKALIAATSDTFNQLDIDGVSSPNDTAGIVASGFAGNCKIDRADGEYDKFTFALRQAATRVCLAIAEDNGERAFSCVVTGARSKSAARTIAKSVVGAFSIKRALAQNGVDTDDVLCSACCGYEKADMQKITLAVGSENGKLTLFENGERIDLTNAAQSRVLSGKNLVISLDLGAGNYTATAIGRADII